MSGPCSLRRFGIQTLGRKSEVQAVLSKSNESSTSQQTRTWSSWPTLQIQIYNDGSWGPARWRVDGVSTKSWSSSNSVLWGSSRMEAVRRNEVTDSLSPRAGNAIWAAYGLDKSTNADQYETTMAIKIRLLYKKLRLVSICAGKLTCMEIPAPQQKSNGKWRNGAPSKQLIRQPPGSVATWEMRAHWQKSTMNRSIELKIFEKCHRREGEWISHHKQTKVQAYLLFLIERHHHVPSQRAPFRLKPTIFSLPDTKNELHYFATTKHSFHKVGGNWQRPNH